MKRITFLTLLLSGFVIFNSCSSAEEYNETDIYVKYLDSFPIPNHNRHDRHIKVIDNAQGYEAYFREIWEEDIKLPAIDFTRYTLLYAQGSMTASSSIAYKLEGENGNYTLNIRANYSADGIYPAVMLPWKCAFLLKNVPSNAVFLLDVDRIEGDLPKGYTPIRNS